MATEAYIVPLGVDGQKLVQPILDAVDQLETLEKKASEAGDSINNSFRDAAKSTQALDSKIDGSAKQLNKIGTAAKLATGELGKMRAASGGALDERPVSRFTRFIEGARVKMREFAKGAVEGYRDAIKAANDYEKAANKTASGTEKQAKKQESLFGSLKKAALAYFSFTALKSLGEQVIKATAQFEKFEAVLTTALGSRSAARESMAELTDIAAKTPFAIEELTGAYVKLVNRGFKPTRQEIIQLGDIAASQGKSIDQLTEALLDGQQMEFERLKEFGIKARKEGDNVSLTFKGVTKTVKSTAEDVRNAILEFGKMPGVAGSMEAVSRTLGGALSNLSDSWNQFMVGIGKASSGGIAKAVGLLSDLVGAAKDFMSVPLPEQLERERVEVNVLAESILGAKDNQELRNAQINELMRQYPEFFKGLEQEELSNAAIEARLIGVNKQYESRIRLAAAQATQQAAQLRFEENLKTIGQERVRLLQAAQRLGVSTAGVDFDDANAVRAFGQKLTEKLKQEIGARSLGEEGKNLLKAIFTDDQIRLPGQLARSLEALTGATADLGESLNLTKAAQAGVNAEQQRMLENNKKIKNELQNKIADIDIELAIGGLSPERLKELTKAREDYAAEIKRIDSGIVDFNKTLETTAAKPTAKVTGMPSKKEIQEAKKQLEDLQKFQEQLRDAEAEGIEGLAERRKAQIQSDLANKKAELDAKEKDIRADKTLNENQLKTLDTIAKLRVQLEKNAAKEIADIDKETFENRQALQSASAKRTLELQEDSLEKTLALIDLETKERLAKIDEQIRKETDARTKALLESERAAATNAGARARTDAILADQQKKLANQEKFLIEEVELSAKYGEKNKHTEEDKQKAILQIRLLYAEKNLAALKAAGKAENDEAVIAANNQIKAYREALGKAADKDKDNLFDFLGVDEDTMRDITKGAAAAADVINSVTAAVTASIQAQIDAKQRQIDQYDEQISKLEESVNKEKELAEKGMANNLGTLESELAEKKKLRDKEIKDRQDLEKKMAAVRKAELAADSLTQISSLITAAANIFEAFSKIPIVGTGLAIAAIATMFTAFAAAKITAFRSVNQQKFAEGDIINGKSHAAGGMKYYSADGSNIVELEDGEFVTKKSSTAKHKRLLRAINKDDFSNLQINDASLKQMLNDMGIRLNDQVKEDAVQTSRAVRNSETVLIHSGIGKAVESYMKNIRDDVKYMADTQRNDEKVVYEDAKTKVVKIGNTTRVITK